MKPVVLGQPRDWLYVAYSAAVVIQRLDWRPDSGRLGLLAGLLLPVTALAIVRLTPRERWHQWGGGAVLALALLRVAVGGSLAAAAAHDPLFWGAVAAIALGLSAVTGRWPVAASIASAVAGACTMVALLLPVFPNFTAPFPDLTVSRQSFSALSDQIGVPATVLLLALWCQAIVAGGSRGNGTDRIGAATRGALLAGLVLTLAGAVQPAGIDTGWIVALGVLLGLSEAHARPPAAGFDWEPVWRRVNPAQWRPVTILVLLEGLFALLLLRSPGTGDVSSFFIGWINAVLTQGPADGYRLIDSNYPPLIAVVLWLAGMLGSAFPLSVFLRFKLSLVAALLVTTICFWRWTSDARLTGLLAVSLVINGVALGYLDTFFAPTLILSLWALQQRRIALFSALFAITSLIKWQPLVILPYLLLHAVSIPSGPASRPLWLVKRWGAVVAPALAVIVLTLASFGVEPIRASVTQGAGRNYLSGTAQNVNWILTYHLTVSDPERYDAVGDGITRIVEVDRIDPGWPWVRVVVLAFVAFYLAALWRLFKSRASFAAAIECSLVGYLSYFMLNIGVHENYLFLATVLAVAAAALAPETTTRAVLIVGMSTLNLLTVYGITGAPLGFAPIVGIDVSVIFSAVNVLLFLVFWVEVVSPRRLLAWRTGESPA